MSAQINGIANTSNNISVENNIIKLSSLKTGNINIFAGSTNNANFTSVNSNIVPNSNNNRNLGTIEKQWSNAYIRDLSVSSIDVSVNLNPLFNDTSHLGSITKTWNIAYIKELGGVNNINGQSYISNPNILTTTNNIYPSNTNSISLGLPNKSWCNAYIYDLSVSNISVSGNIILNISGGGSIININKITADISNNKITSTSRLYQEISGDISWNSVNGYYRLAKHAYPVLNPLSSGVKAVTGLTRTGPLNAWWVCCCWSPELGLFVAGAQNNSNVMISYDGINWSLKAAGAFQSICWSPELKIFVAVASGTVRTSSDGISWSSPKTGIEASNWISVCWSPELGIFVAVAQNGTNRTMISRDGTSWKANPVTGFAQWLRVCWSPEVRRFVACGINAANSLMSSSDGITWDTKAPPEGGNWQGLCWSPQLGLFVITSKGTGNNILTSPDGVTWTNRTAINSATMFSQCLTWIPELGIFISCTSGTEIQISTDAITWTRITVSTVGADCRSICWSPELGIFVAPTLTSALVITSSLKGRPPTSYNVFDSSFNRIDEFGKWTFANIDISTNLNPLTNNTGSLGAPPRSWGNAYIRDLSVTNISVSGNIILNISGGGSIININRLSADISNNKITTTSRLYQEISGDISWNAVNGYYGLAKDAYPALNPLSSGAKAVLTWTNRPIPTAGIWMCICWSPKLRLFVTLLDGLNPRAMVSDNGINWTSITIQAASYTSIIWCQELEIFVAVTYYGTRVITSRDGTTWDYSATGAPGNWWFSICWSPQLGLFVAVAGSGTDRVMTSKDGKSWKGSKAAENNYWSSICWSPELGLFVAVASSGPGLNRVMTSKNGIDWALSVVTLNAWNSVCWSAQLGIFVAVSTDGENRVMISQNGTFWTDINVLQYFWFAVCWCAELKLFVAVSNDSSDRMFSSNGVNWTYVNIASARSICWSPELGIFATIGQSGSVQTSSLKARPPTSYNVFDNSFNSIDESGKWTFANIDISTCNIRDLSSLSIDITNNLNPLTNNNGNLGSRLKYWGNAYIRDLSLGTIELSGNLNPLNDTSGSLGMVNKRFGNAYIRDLSIGSIDVSVNINSLTANNISLGGPINYWGNAYIRDLSVGSIDVSVNLNPLIHNSGSIGLDNKRWGVINTVTLYQNGSEFTSDDRIKHNESIITNGLTVISQLTPKFYQKTLEMLDAHYYGDLTGYTWNYESGLIAQELLQIKDLSFVVTGGDYYDSNNTLLENQYSVNYNSVFVYGLAAIKELDVKVKNQESIINSLLTRIEALENKP